MSERAASPDRPFDSARLCRCGHQEMHHVAARLRCPVVISIPPRGQLACSCLEFSPLTEETP